MRSVEVQAGDGAIDDPHIERGARARGVAANLKRCGGREVDVGSAQHEVMNAGAVNPPIPGLVQLRDGVDRVQIEGAKMKHPGRAIREGHHAELGAWRLEKLITTIEDQKHAYDLADKMRKDLFIISCENTSTHPEAIGLVKYAYGWNI